MIKNERQYRITKAQLSELQEALEQMRDSLKTRMESSPIDKARVDGLQSQIDQLETEVKDYESLWGSKRSVEELESFDQIPNALIRARLALGLTQKDLGDRLGLSEQQIQRYESTDYETASLSRIRDVIDALDLKLSKRIQFPNNPLTMGDLVKKMERAGMEREFIVKRLLPPSVASELRERHATTQEADSSSLLVASQIASMFGWTEEEIFGGNPLSVDTSIIGNVKFKVRAGANPNRLGAYTLYAHYVGLVLLQSAWHLPQKILPRDPYQIHKEIQAKYGSFTLDNSLRYVWSLGVPVLALDDRGGFQGTHFREKGRSIIIVNQKTTSESRWLFTLFHEFWHAANESVETSKDFELEDLETISSTGNKTDPQEQEANLFSGAVLLGRSPDKLVHLAWEQAGHNLAKLKEAVINVGKAQNVSIESLANITAFRLSAEGYSWWGPAENLQSTNENIQRIPREVLLDYVDLSRLSGPDLDLLRRALGFAEAVQYE